MVVSDDEEEEHHEIEPATSENISIKPKKLVKEEYYDEEIDDEGCTGKKTYCYH